MGVLTDEEAYRAMYLFLTNYWDLVGKPDAIGSLLGSMSTLTDGGTADPAIHDDWLRALAKAKMSDAETTRLHSGR